MTKTKSVRRRDYRKLKFLGLLVFVAVFSFVFLAQRKLEDDTNAANLANFDAGYIISDFQMTDYNSMSEAEIQKFLWSKGKCYNTDFRYVGTRSDKFSDSTPPTTWHVKDGHTVCLAEESNINGESIAHIIWQAAQDFRINPKVLIVLLQKETGIITDPIPNSWDYQRATGYGCPDTAACSEKYYGLKNQIRNAASLFRIVMDGNSSYYPIGNNYIQYNPNAACGGSVVNIRNLATSALYRYTPYQPNAGALAAGYGTATCGAYGNRNFFAYFEDWFGRAKDGEILVEAKTKFERPIKNGTYQIISKAYPEKAIDIKGGIKNGAMSADLQIFAEKTIDDAENQIFEIKYNESDGYYSITNTTMKATFDVKGAKTANSTGVQVYPEHNGCNQDWLLEKDSEGYFVIISRCSSRVLDAAPSGRIVIFDNHGGDNQKWKLMEATNTKTEAKKEEKKEETKEEKKDNSAIEEGTYQFVSKAYSDKVIDIKGGIKKDLTSADLQVFAKKSTDLDNQIFKVSYDKNNNSYSVVNVASGLTFDVKGARTVNSTGVQVYADNGNCNQRWSFEKDNAGYYTITSKCSGRVLDAAPSGRIVIFDSHGGDNQKWKLIKIN